ncbi:MAG: fluoride efflux transporter CrcB [Gemmatimonadaceae bacterium]
MNPALILLVALGGAIGSASRYALSFAVQSRTTSLFPWGTLLVNVTGSFLVGLIMRYALGGQAISAEARLFLTVGFCGGYTTFSTFSYESLRLIEDADYRRAGLYIVSSVALSLAATAAGFVLARGLLTGRQG